MHLVCQQEGTGNANNITKQYDNRATRGQIRGEEEVIGQHVTLSWVLTRYISTWCVITQLGKASLPLNESRLSSAVL